jgi:hypothetical protein
VTDDRCARCRGEFPGYDLVGTVTDDRAQTTLCWRCFNDRMAERDGIPFENPDLAPLTLRDAHGRRCTFHFRTRLLGALLAVDAFEIKDGAPGGYELMEIGSSHDDPDELFERLKARFRRLAGRKHIRRAGRAWELAEGDTVRGRFVWDDETGGVLPRLVIDGREIGWEEFGRMLSSREGWQFRIEVFGREEDR